MIRLAKASLFTAIGGWAFVASSAVAQNPPAISPAAVFNRYCVTCHNEKLKTGGFVLDPSALTSLGANAEMWEKVDRKLRSYSMPPAGAPRPDQATYDAVATALETELDRASAQKPNPGKLPLLHRLTRTEYQNAIRDLLALQALPKEMDYPVLLPPDNTSSGFDNIADLLFVSPSTMQRYLDAARKIARLAVGDPNHPLLVNIYKTPVELPQIARVNDLSFGTRGGAAIRTDFPVDGEYAIKFEVAGAAREVHQVEITIDGEREKLTTVGGTNSTGRSGRLEEDTVEKGNEVRIPVKAGPRLVGVTFLEHNEARDEATLKPRMRSRGPQPSIASVTIEGPLTVTASGDTPSRRQIFICHPGSSTEEPACAKRILTALARRAYRRPVTDADFEDLMPFYSDGVKQAGFEFGIERALERLLVSPQFLFRIERDPAGAAPGTRYRIGDLELASRLSFFLWSSIPDDELLNLAAAGKLKDPVVLEGQVRRMMGDPRSRALVTNFAAQWLFLRDIEAKQPDEILFPDFDESLRAAFETETILFLDCVLRDDRSVLDLLTANYTFVNARLAKHYGIPNVEGSYFRRVELPQGSVRGGLLGQGSILTITSYSVRTSPVLRGKWVLENLLSAAPPPPPATVPALKTEGSEPGKVLSMREAMTQHRANPACIGCHARMDPIGFAMENFDAVGKWRDKDNGNRIDVSGVLPDGTKFEGMAGLKQALLRHPEQFVSTIAERLLMYAVGRNVQYYDAPTVRSIVREAAHDNYSFLSLVLGVVNSTPFQMRQTQDAADAARAVKR